MFGVSRLPRCSQGILGNVIFPFIAEWTIGQATHDINQEKINEYVIGLHILVIYAIVIIIGTTFNSQTIRLAKYCMLVIRLHSNSYGGYVVDLTKAR